VTTVTRCWLEEAEAIRLEDSLEPVTVNGIPHFGRNCSSIGRPKNLGWAFTRNFNAMQPGSSGHPPGAPGCGESRRAGPVFTSKSTLTQPTY
jgi:hypothetical protein